MGLPGVGAIALVLACGTADAGNGLNLIGFGTESVGMGGADIAVARDTSALNTNPAGLTQLHGPAFDSYFFSAFALDVAHADRYGNDRGVDNNVIAVGGGGYARPVEGTSLVVGLGFFGQGGAGNVYKDLKTPFGGRDELSGLFGILRVIPGIAWRPSERLSIGVGLPVTHAMAKQRIFPGVSVAGPDPARSFFGATIKDLQGTRVGARLGMRYALSPGLSVAAVYAPKMHLPLNRGFADVNMSAVGLGTVRYRSVQLSGLALPQEWGIGTAWQMSRATLVSFEVTRLDWGSALRAQTLTLSQPENAAAPATITQTSRLDWNNQYVFSLGAAHDVHDDLTIYAGINYGKRPAPAQTTSPLLAATGERHLTGGARMKMSDGWFTSGAVEYLLPHRVTYDNPELPFGPGAQERNRYVALHLMLSRRW